jgi:hypothetical protein
MHMSSAESARSRWKIICSTLTAQERRESRLDFSVIKIAEHLLLYRHDSGELYLPQYAVPKETLNAPHADIRVLVEPAVVKWEGMFFISASLLEQLSPEIAGHCAMLEKRVKERLGETTNN